MYACQKQRCFSSVVGACPLGFLVGTGPSAICIRSKASPHAAPSQNCRLHHAARGAAWYMEGNHGKLLRLTLCKEILAYETLPIKFEAHSYPEMADPHRVHTDFATGPGPRGPRPDRKQPPAFCMNGEIFIIQNTFFSLRGTTIRNSCPSQETTPHHKHTQPNDKQKNHCSHDHLPLHQSGDKKSPWV